MFTLVVNEHVWHQAPAGTTGCRVYSYSVDNVNVDALAHGSGDWFTRAGLQRSLGESHAICRTVDTWLRRDIVRGKGKASSQRRRHSSNAASNDAVIGVPCVPCALACRGGLLLSWPSDG